MRSIPLVDLQAQMQPIRREIDAAIAQVLDRGDYILGESVQRFEEEFAAYCGAAHGIGVASGTDALLLSLRAAKIGPGDEVLLPANTFIATALAVHAAGALPVLVDVDPSTFLPAPGAWETAITPRTRALIPVHLFGRLADVEALTTLANRRGLYVIEDAAQAHGARRAGRIAGSFGALGCFSFYPGKNLGCAGDGGMIVTSNDEWAAELRALRNYGSPRKYHHPISGWNSRLDTLQASILRVKLRHLDAWNRLRAEKARCYQEALTGIGDLILPEVPEAGAHVFHLYVIRSAQRDALLSHLSQQGIQAGIHYPVPIHLQGAFAYLGQTQGSFPGTECLAREILSLPMFPELDSEQLLRVTSSIRDFFDGRSA